MKNYDIIIIGGGIAGIYTIQFKKTTSTFESIIITKI